MGTGLITVRNDPRLTPLGGFLRITKLNELPQLFNVFKGDMSFVGPRPLAQKQFDTYPDYVKERIYDSKPGITGIGSIIFRDEEKMVSNSGQEPATFYRNVISPYKGALEIWYQDHKCIKTDLLILFLTAWQIIFSRSELAHKVFKSLPKKTF